MAPQRSSPADQRDRERNRDPGPDPLVRLVRSDALRPDEVVALRELFDEAWSDDVEGFTDQDWGHAVGGVHVIAEADGRVVAHASVVRRELHTAAIACGTGSRGRRDAAELPAAGPRLSRDR